MVQWRNEDWRRCVLHIELERRGLWRVRARSAPRGGRLKKEPPVVRGVRAGRRAREALRFVPSGKVVGFRSSGLSAYNNVDPHTVVRELVQNSLDAGTKAKRDVVRVVFEIDEVRRGGHSGALEVSRAPAVCDRHAAEERLSRTIAVDRRSDGVVDRLGSCACAVGDGQRDRAGQWRHGGSLLGDGQSAKGDESSAGSYGNGHMTSFPASDLRYVVYGGVHEGERTVSGHAILASHEFGRKVCGEDGYLAKKIRPNDLFDRFDFSNGSSTPLLKEKLDGIEKTFGTGSVVGILGFQPVQPVFERRGSAGRHRDGSGDALHSRDPGRGDGGGGADRRGRRTDDRRLGIGTRSWRGGANVNGATGIRLGQAGDRPGRPLRRWRRRIGTR